MNTPENKKESWEDEFREYFDKCLKPKKPTIKNLDRELCVDFIKKVIAKERKRAEAKVFRECIRIIYKRTEIPADAKNPTRDGTVILGERLVELIESHALSLGIDLTKNE